MSRENESRLRELEKTVDALTDELIDLKKRVAELEDEPDVEIEREEIGVEEEENEEEGEVEKTEDDIYVA